MQNFKILIVDDIVINRILLQAIIEELGFECREAEDGRKAIEMLKNEHFNMVFMDIEMPVMNGIETTKYIREELPAPLSSIPVIALTAHNPSMFFDDFRHAGFTNLLTKPYSIDKVLSMIKEIKNSSNT